MINEITIPRKDISKIVLAYSLGGFLPRSIQSKIEERFEWYDPKQAVGVSLGIQALTMLGTAALGNPEVALTLAADLYIRAPSSIVYSQNTDRDNKGFLEDRGFLPLEALHSSAVLAKDTIQTAKNKIYNFLEE